MSYSEIFTLTENGLHVDPNLLRPVGIYDKSKCYGILVKQVKDEKLDQLPHLILSPIPEAAWAGMVRIQVRVKNKLDSIAKVLKNIAENDINIVSIQSAVSGHTHVTINIVGEILKIRSRVKSIKEVPRDAPDKRREMITQLSLEIFETICDVERSLEFNSDSDDSPLYDSKNEDGRYLFCDKILNALIHKKYSKSDANKILELTRIHDDHLLKTVHCQWVRTLALYSLYTLDKKVWSFKYDASNGALLTDKQKFKSQISSVYNLDFPTLVLGTFKPEDLYVRIVPFENNTAKRMLARVTTISECEYSISDGMNVGVAAMSTERLKKYFNDHISMSTVISQNTLGDSERRELSVCGVLKSDDQELSVIDDDLTKYICSKTCDDERGINYTHYVNSRRITPYKIFISAHEDWLKHNMTELHDIGCEIGFIPLVGDTSTGSVTENALELLSEADAFILILSLNGNETTIAREAGGRVITPEIGWLLFELGAARQKSLPVIRMLDTTYMSKEVWREMLKIDQDTLTPDFCHADSNKEFKNVFRGVANNIISEIDKNDNCR